MKSLTLRSASPNDARRVVEWIQSTPSNDFDPSIAEYPHLHTFVVEEDGSPLLYIPVHPVLCIESVAARPGITGRQYIEALLEAKRATESLAGQYGIREIYTSSGYEPMIKTLRRHGYEPVTGALRKKIND